MATLDERVTALEQQFVTFHDQTVADIHTIEENTTILLGVIRHQGQDIRRIFERLTSMEQRQETIDRHLEAMDDHLSGIEQRQEAMEQRLETMDQHLGTVDQRLGAVDQRLGGLETKSDEHTALLTQILERLAG